MIISDVLIDSVIYIYIYFELSQTLKINQIEYTREIICLKHQLRHHRMSELSQHML